VEAVTEHDLFKYLVLRNEDSAQERALVLKNIAVFSSRMTTNIFFNEYYVLYEAIMKAKKYGTVLTYNQLYQIIINNIDSLIARNEIIADEFTENVSDRQVVKETLADLVMTTYEELKSLTVNDHGELNLSLELYLNSWGVEELKKVIAVQHEINAGGKKIGNKFLQGIEESNIYYQENYGKIKQLVFNAVIETRNVIRTDTMSMQDIKGLYGQESINRGVASTGINAVDDHLNDFRIGDMITIMGQPGAGKTRFTANIMYNALMKGNNVLWYPLEGSGLQAFSLIVARHIIEKFEDRSDLDDKNIYDQSYPENLGEMVDTAIQDLLRNPEYGKLNIRNIPLYDDEVMFELEKEWDEGFHFDVLCIDYISLVMNKKNEPPTLYLSRLIKTLKTQAMSFKNHGFLLLLPHQLTKEVIQSLIRGEDTTIVGSSDTSEVIKSSDISFSLYRSEDQILQDKITVFFTKTRFSRPLPPTEVLALHGKCYFSDVPQ
jgi:hypothetical protein